MKGSARKCLAIGALVGLLDGLAFAVSYNTSFDFLAPWLLPLALPCLAVVMRFPAGLNAPEWIPWTAGVLAMGLLGAFAGLMIHRLRRPEPRSTMDSTTPASDEAPRFTKP